MASLGAILPAATVTNQSRDSEKMSIALADRSLDLFASLIAPMLLFLLLQLLLLSLCKTPAPNFRGRRRDSPPPLW